MLYYILFYMFFCNISSTSSSRQYSLINSQTSKLFHVKLAPCISICGTKFDVHHSYNETLKIMFSAKLFYINFETYHLTQAKFFQVCYLSIFVYHSTEYRLTFYSKWDFIWHRSGRVLSALLASLGLHFVLSLQRIIMKLRRFTNFGIINEAVSFNEKIGNVCRR